MNASAMIDDQFDNGHRAPILLPERSRLFALSPVEADPEQRESLTSLLIRTCGAHSVNPRRLIGAVFCDVAPEIEALAYPSFFNRLAGTINGLGKYANLFVQAMETLSGQPNLNRLTLLPWKGLFPHNGQGTLARHPRWCSACLLEQRRSREDIYFPLLWSLEAYRHCTIHGQPLDDRCPHCGKPQPFLPRYPDQAICHHCLRSLIRMPSSAAGVDVPTASEFETWVAMALGTMVAHQGTQGFAPSAGQFHLAVKAIVEAAAGGNRAAFCRSIGFNEYALKNWLTKGERPSMTQFLALTYAVQVPPVDLVAVNTNSNPIPRTAVRIPGKLKIRMRSQNGSDHHRARFRRWLQDELRTGPAQSVSAIAKRWGVTAQYLRYWFPDACRQVTARFRESLRQKSAERLETQIRRVQEIVREIRNGNLYPSRRKVDAIVRRHGGSLGKRALLNAYRAALAA